MFLLVLARAIPAAVASASATPSDAQPAVVSYPPEFVADDHPNTAIDMINRLPGFALDTD